MIDFEGLRPSHYVLFNVNQVGYYRVMYDRENWMALINELKNENFKHFSPNTRAMLIDDAGVFVENESLDMNIFLELISYLEHEVKCMTS